MTRLSRWRSNAFVLGAVVLLSAATMLWLFWRYPVKTGIATLIILTALGVSARLARSLESDGTAERSRIPRG